jgi:hypothetical protein
MTRTVALLEVSPATYVEIKDKLLAAGYEHTFMPDGAIDLEGIALKEPPRHANSCSNQNVIHPLGAYDGVEECGCSKR